MIHENFGLKGKLHLVLRDKDGNIILERQENNLVVQGGREFITSRILGNTSTVMSHMAIGTSSTAAATAQTTLLGEVGRVALTSSAQQTVTLSNDSVRFIATFPAGTGTGALREAGVLNNSSGGTMLCRSVFDLITKGAGDSLTVTWTVTLL